MKYLNDRLTGQTNMDSSIIEKEYNSRKDIYKRLASVVEDSLKNKLKLENIKTAFVISRIKDCDSFIDKINRSQCGDPFNQIFDIVGLRIVCLYTEDKAKIDKIIKDEFEIFSREDKDEKLGPDRMGYSDLSFVVNIPSSYSGPIYDGLHSIKFEIQVRTVLTDAIANISHDLCYKKEHLLPCKLIRDVNIVFSVMELAQKVCDTIRERRKEYVDEIRSSAENEDLTGFLQQPINDDTLRVFTKRFFPNLPIKEHIHELILRDLNYSKYTKLGDIKKAIEYSQEFLKCYSTKSPDLFKAGSDYITKSLGYYDEEFLNRHPFAQQTKDAVNEFKRQNP